MINKKKVYKKLGRCQISYWKNKTFYKNFLMTKLQINKKIIAS